MPGAGIKTVSNIEFKVLDPERLRAMAAVEISTAETYDLDGFPVEGSLMDPRLGVLSPGLRCKSCGQRMNKCPGHFGLIELVRPVIHVKFSEAIRDCLVASCSKCGRVPLQPDVLQGFKEKMKLAGTPEERREIGRDVIRKAKSAKKCNYCENERELVVFKKPGRYQEGPTKRLFPTEIRERLVRIPSEEVWLMGFDKDVRPEWWVLTVLAVPPVTMRPSISLETGQKSEDDLTHKLSDIVRTNQRLKENINAGAPQIIVESMWDLLQYHITTYFDNAAPGVPPANDRTGRPLRTLTQRLTGKEGRFRLSLSGKRVNFSARSVVNPDPFISINEVGIPREVAEKLTYPEKVTEWNLEHAKELVKRTGYPMVRTVITPTGLKKKVITANREEICNELLPGYTIERDMVDGDVVLFNRQPSLHRMSEMAHKVKILPSRSFRIHPAVTKPYNADFDGDNMNVHFPQELEARVEAEELLSVEKHIMSPRYGGPVISAQEDLISGVALLTLKSTKVTREDAMNYAQILGVSDLPKPANDDGTYTGKQIFSLILPKDLNMSYRSNVSDTLRRAGICTAECKGEKCKHDANVVIRDGELVCGIIDDNSVGEKKGKLLLKLARSRDEKYLKWFIDKVSELALVALNRIGITLSLSEFEADMEKRNKIVQEALKKGEKVVESYKKGTLEPLPGLTYEESFEREMIILAMETKKAALDVALEAKLQRLASERPSYDALLMMMVGARGKVSNIENISALRGQTLILGERPREGYEDRITPCFERGDVGLASRGFVTHNLLEGVPAKEFFFDAMGGRIGEIEKSSLSTRKSGYLQRQLIYAFQDVGIKNDHSARSATGDVIQFLYGGDGVFPMNTTRGKIFDFEELAEEE